jgi:hypothetical protein
MALGGVFVASVVTCWNSLVAVVEDAGYANGQGRGSRRGRDRSRVNAEARWGGAGMACIAFSGRPTAASASALARGRKRRVRRRLRSIDRTFPVAHNIRRDGQDSRIGQARTVSAIRVPPARVNGKRPLLAVIGTKKPAAASLPRRVHESR